MISRKKPVYLRFNGDWNLDGNSDINLQGENLESVNCIRNFVPLSAVLLDELCLVMFCNNVLQQCICTLSPCDCNRLCAHWRNSRQ